MPLLFSHCATLMPSLSHANARKAPPGATTTAAPAATAGEGRNSVTLGSLTLAIVRSPAGGVVVVSATVHVSAPGALPGQRRITWGAGACVNAAWGAAKASSTIAI